MPCVLLYSFLPFFKPDFKPLLEAISLLERGIVAAAATYHQDSSMPFHRKSAALLPMILLTSPATFCFTRTCNILRIFCVHQGLGRSNYFAMQEVAENMRYEQVFLADELQTFFEMAYYCVDEK